MVSMIVEPFIIQLYTYNITYYLDCSFTRHVVALPADTAEVNMSLCVYIACHIPYMVKMVYLPNKVMGHLHPIN